MKIFFLIASLQETANEINHTSLLSMSFGTEKNVAFTRPSCLFFLARLIQKNERGTCWIESEDRIVSQFDVFLILFIHCELQSMNRVVSLVRAYSLCWNASWSFSHTITLLPSSAFFSAGQSRRVKLNRYVCVRTSSPFSSICGSLGWRKGSCVQSLALDVFASLLNWPARILR